jgi:uridine kinase
MNTRPLFLGISGPSCGGKTTLAAHLTKAWGHLSPALLRLDSYYQANAELALEQRAKVNYDHPDSLDWFFLLSHLKELARGRPVDQPVYDYEIHTRSGRVTRTHSDHLIIVEGIFALDKRVAPFLDLGVYVELDHKKCLERRIERDVNQRGRTRQSVLEQFQKTVRPMCDKYVLPTKKAADLVVAGDDVLDSTQEKISGLLGLP